MRINMSAKPAVFPMPVLMVGTYDENGTVDVIMACWGITYRNDQIILNLMANHKTVKNIQARKAFTVALADEDHLADEDYLGTVSGNSVSNKFERTHLHAARSEHVDAPVIEEFPLCMECALEDIQIEGTLAHVIGRITNISVDEKCVKANGHIDAMKLKAIVWDTFGGGYYRVGEKIGQNCTEYKKLK